MKTKALTEGMVWRDKRQAIRAKCLDCSCDSYTEVEECSFKDCPLWIYRMGYETKLEGIVRRDRKHAIKAKCMDCCRDMKDVVQDCGLKDCPLWIYRLGYEVDFEGNVVTRKTP